MTNSRIPPAIANHMQNVQLEKDFVKVAGENQLLTAALESILGVAPDGVGKPDGLDYTQHPNLFAFLAMLARNEQLRTTSMLSMDGTAPHSLHICRLSAIIILTHCSQAK